MTKEDIKILLVDDEKQFVDTLAERLSMRGFEARVAYDGPQALKAVEQPTDVIVLDLRMPGMDGFEVLRNVKKSNPQVQVIILTGHGGAGRADGPRMGAYNFLKSHGHRRAAEQHPHGLSRQGGKRHGGRFSGRRRRF